MRIRMLTLGMILLFSTIVQAREDESRNVQFVNKTNAEVTLNIEDTEGNQRPLKISSWENSKRGVVITLQRRAYKRYLGKVKYLVELTIDSSSAGSQKMDSTTIDYMNKSIDNAPTETGAGTPTFEVIQESSAFRISYVGVKPLERQIIGTPQPIPE